VFNRNFNTNLLAATPSPYCTDISNYLLHIQLLNQGFSCETKNALQQLKDDRIKYYQFKDIPVSEEIPPTATNYISEIPKKTFQSEGVIGAVSLELGQLFNYRETSEFIFYDIYPTKGYEHSRSFVNSKKMLAFHSDGSAHPELCPDYVLLYCVRSDKKAVNLFVDLDALLEHLPDRIVDVLMQPLFKHMVSESPEYFEVKPILFKEGHHITIKYDEENTFGVNTEAISSQKCLNEMLQKIAVVITNSSRSLLILNNKRSLHARTSFNPKYDGNDRWIKCAFVTTNDIETGSIVSLSL